MFTFKYTFRGQMDLRSAERGQISQERRLRPWYWWGLDRVSQVKRGKDGERQDGLTLLHICNALFLFLSFFARFFSLRILLPFTLPSFSRHHDQPCPTSPSAICSIPPNSVGAQTRPSAATGAPPDSVTGD